MENGSGRLAVEEGDRMVKIGWRERRDRVEAWQTRASGGSREDGFFFSFLNFLSSKKDVAGQCQSFPASYSFQGLQVRDVVDDYSRRPHEIGFFFIYYFFQFLKIYDGFQIWQNYTTTAVPHDDF
jgi:ABC-type phosphate transport system substrate-binding protein